jgi:hypothetical protein
MLVSKVAWGVPRIYAARSRERVEAGGEGGCIRRIPGSALPYSKREFKAGGRKMFAKVSSIVTKPVAIVLLIALLGALVLQGIYALVVFALIASRIPGKEAMTPLGTLGDMFGGLTAFFTGVAFIGILGTFLLQHRDLKQHEEVGERQRTTLSINTILRLSEQFNSERMRKSRYIASSFFLKAHQRLEAHRQNVKPGLAEGCAVIEVLNFFETIAHFTNHNQLDRDMVLNEFWWPMEIYAHFAREYYPPARDEGQLPWVELRKLRGTSDNWEETKGFRGWLLREQAEHFIGDWLLREQAEHFKGFEKLSEKERKKAEERFKPKVEEAFEAQELEAALKREKVRCRRDNGVLAFFHALNFGEDHY